MTAWWLDFEAAMMPSDTIEHARVRAEELLRETLR